jgi:ABC-type sugar transport system ATPase subunit
MAEVVLEGVAKVYPGGIPAVRDLTLRVQPGELLVIMGPSGSGKTTILRLIAGLETPTAGTISLDGRRVNDLPPHRRNVAMVFQRPALYPHWSVSRNLGLGLRGVTAASRIAEVVELLRLEGLLDRRPGQLSGGQQQRVALGRALARQPAVFLLDEPLNQVDALARSELRREVHLLHERLGTTMIYVTHDPAEALALADRLAVLSGGVLQQLGTPEELYARPVNRFVAATVGWPPMAFLDGRLVATGSGPTFQGEDVTLPLPTAPAREGPVVLGLRAEAVTLSAPAAGRPGLRMDVLQSERWGPGRLLRLRHGRWQLSAYATEGSPARAGDRVAVVLNLGQAHLFDPATGQAW